jgi:hypothetical protein
MPVTICPDDLIRTRAQNDVLFDLQNAKTDGLVSGRSLQKCLVKGHQMIELMTHTAGLDKLREAFPDHQISYLPKAGIKLAYVGHAALTDRLLDADLHWSWEPLSMASNGLPMMDDLGGMWIKLTVCGVTRLGYGHAGAKIGGDAIKEVIGDALRNAAMRFGAALELWHKGELHQDIAPLQEVALHPETVANIGSILKNIAASKSLDILRANYEAAMQMLDASEHAEIKIIANQRKSELLKKVTK